MRRGFYDYSTSLHSPVQFPVQTRGQLPGVWKGGSRSEMKQRNQHEIEIDSANKQGKIKLTILYFPGLYGCNDGLRLGLCLPSSNACMPSASGPPDTAAPTLLQRSPAFRRCDFHNCCKACRIIFHDCSLPQTGKIKHVFVCIFLLCSIFRGKGNWGLGIGDWVLRTGHRALALGTGHWALGRGVWGLVVGHCIGHCRLAHGRHQAKAIKATYREVSDEPVWRQTYKSPIIFSYVRSS